MPELAHTWVMCMWRGVYAQEAGLAHPPKRFPRSCPRDVSCPQKLPHVPRCSQIPPPQMVRNTSSAVKKSHVPRCSKILIDRDPRWSQMVPDCLRYRRGGDPRRGQAGIQAVYIHGGQCQMPLSDLATFIGYSFHRVLILYETVTK